MKFLSKVLFLSSFCFFHHASFGQNIEVSGNVSGVWNVDTVRVIDNISIPASETLEIEPGVVVEFQGYFHLDVKGNLQATGTPLSPIIFTVSDTLGLHEINSPMGAWRGIIIQKSRDEIAPEAHFSHCHFEYAKTWEGDELQHGGAMYVKDTDNVSIDHCSFIANHAYLSGGAVYSTSSSPTVTNSFFSGNKAGHLPYNNDLYGYGGALCGVNSKSSVKNNVFFDNWASGMGGGISFDQSFPIIENNVFDGNDGPLGGAIGLLRSSLNSTIANNLIVNNFSMFFGAGIAFVGVNATLANNTFAGNMAPGAGGGAMYFNNECEVGVYNNIFWDNVASTGNLAFVFDISNPSFHNNIIQGGYSSIQGGGEYVFVDNIDQDPLFKQQGEHPYQPNTNSPCINAGIENEEFLELPETDLAGNPRVQLGRVDIGAYESPVSTVNIVSLPKPNPTISVSPNPASNFARINIQVTEPDTYQLTVIDTRGKEMMELFNGHLLEGNHDFSINSPQVLLGKGMFFVLARSKKYSTSAKLVVIGQ